MYHGKFTTPYIVVEGPVICQQSVDHMEYIYINSLSQHIITLVDYHIDCLFDRPHTEAMNTNLDLWKYSTHIHIVSIMNFFTTCI